MNSVHCGEKPLKSIFRKRLLAWYDAHARDLPWRRDRDPYRVWVSEIMLQQTRVAAVIEHYHEFLRRFPTVDKLARASQASVLAVWSGLGYYRRARMMHAAAKVITEDLRGKFPTTAAKLETLPGIGRYTSAAIASIAFGEPAAVVDGNVQRVLQRFSGERLAAERVWREAQSLLDRNRPGDFNQGMMELGATVCTPRAPSCLTCPIVELCATRGELAGSSKPARQKKCEIHYSLDYRDGAVFLVRRAPNVRLMPGMWELPEVESDPARPASFVLRHSITVTDYTVMVRRSSTPANVKGHWVPMGEVTKLALTGLTRKILRRAQILPLRNAHGLNP